jgi:predicted DNA-binding antitoxin AbrB/MazE fold protein
MAEVIDAIFENGVFKPLEKIEMKEHEKVTIKILSLDQWQSRFDRIIEKVHKKAKQYTPQEIETDISQAIKEIRESKRTNQSSN